MTWKWRSAYTVCNFSCISVYKSHDDGSQLQPKHVAVNKSIKTRTVCSSGMFLSKIQKTKFDTHKKQRLKPAILNVFVFSFWDNKIKIFKLNDNLSFFKSGWSPCTGQYSLTTNCLLSFFFSYGAEAQRGPWPPHSWGFYITHDDATH